MRITIVSRIYRPEPAAASVYLGAVADALVHRGHEVAVLTVTPPPGMAVESHGERVHTFPVLRDHNGYVRGYLPYMSFDVPLALRLLFTRRPDVVFMEPPPTTGVVVRIVCALRRIPYVYDAADIWSDAARLEGTSEAVVNVVRRMERFAVRGAAHIVTISRGVHERLRLLGATSPVSITGFGADTRLFTVTQAPPERVFVYPGSYAPSHGAEVLVDALADFSTTHPGYTLRFIGNGPERPTIQARAAELGLTDQIEFIDPVPPAELVDHLARAVASLATIKPGTIYEYAYASKAFSSLAAGCPVIFAGPGPTIDLLQEATQEARAGVACPYDPSAIADGMRGFADRRLSSDERTTLAAWTASTHSLETVAREVAGILESTARGGAS